MTSKKNSEGYLDLTAYEGTRQIEKEEKEKEETIKKMMEHFRYIAKLNGFKITNRITFEDKETGRCYR